MKRALLAVTRVGWAAAMAAIVTMAATIAPSIAQAQSAATTYPNRSVRVIVPFPPGGATDIVGRLVAQKLQETWGQPFVIENRAGAGSNIGSDAVAKSAPDGYTLLVGTIANATNMSIYPKMPYDTLRDFAPVTQVMSAPSVLVVGLNVPVSNLQELVAYAKARPGQLSFASSGAGGSPHLAGEMLKLRAAIDMIHVPYKGAAPALADVLASSVTMGFKTALSAIPHMQSGKLKPIAVAASKRLAQIPNVPTMAEAGIADFEVNSWNGFLAPAKTPPEIIAKLQQEIARILQRAEVRQIFTAQAAEAVGSTPEQFGAYIRSEIDKWAKVVKASGARID